jgi:hypothetical protein
MAHSRLRIAASTITLQTSSECSRIHTSPQRRSFDRVGSFGRGGPQRLYHIAYAHPVVRFQGAKAPQVPAERAAGGHLRGSLMLEAGGQTGLKCSTDVGPIGPASDVPGHCGAGRKRPPDDRAPKLIRVCFYTRPAGDEWGQGARMGLERLEYPRIEMQPWR